MRRLGRGGAGVALFVAATFFSWPAIAASSCSLLMGRWLGGIATGVAYRHLAIQFDEARSALVLDFDTDPADPGKGFREAYTADGVSHPGDGSNTGTSYVARCQEGGARIEREGLLVKPLVSELSRLGEELELRFWVEGAGFETKQLFTRAPRPGGKGRDHSRSRQFSNRRSPVR